VAPTTTGAGPSKSTSAGERRSHGNGGRSRAGEQARGPLDPVLRIGWFAKGVVYGLIGVLALQIAFGNRSEDADQEGALQTIASQSFGTALLWAVAVGLAFYAVGRILEAALVATDREWYKRVQIGASGLIYGSFALVAVQLATGQGGGGSSDNQEETLTARALEWPAGQVLVGLAGIAVMAGGAYLVWRAVSKKYVEELDLDRAAGRARTLAIALGLAGVAARGVAIGLIGWFLLHAAIQDQPDEAAGLDEALRQLGEAAYGKILLTILALGLMAYGATCMFHARYRRA
jgi:hypothetical protein